MSVDVKIHFALSTGASAAKLILEQVGEMYLTCIPKSVESWSNSCVKTSKRMIGVRGIYTKTRGENEHNVLSCACAGKK